MKIKFLTMACAIALVFSGCGGTALSGEPGQGKWRNSNITGSVTAEETIRLQDDFAAAADQALLAGAESGTGSFVTVTRTVCAKKQKLIEECLPEGEEGELKKYAELASDWESRNADGAEPLRPYMEAIEAISSLDDLTAYACDTEKNPFCLGILMPTFTSQSQSDPTVASLAISTPDYMLGDHEAYFSLTNDALERREYTNRITEHILGKLGYSKEDAAHILQANYRFEKKLAGTDMLLTDSDMPDMQLDFSGCTEAVGTYPLKDILLSRGFPEDGKYYMNTKTAAKAAALYTEQNLADIKGMLMVHLAAKAALYLDRETFELEQSLQKSRLTPSPEDLPVPEEQKAQQELFDTFIAGSAAGVILDRIYVERYVDPEAIADLEKLTQDVIGQFRVLFTEEAWLSEAGQTAALEKLDALVPHVLVPDFDMIDLSGFHVLSREEGGNFLAAVAASELCKQAHSAALCTQPYDRTRWDPLSASTTQTNAYYMPTTNGIYILAGAAEAPIYSPDMSYEEKLGGICTIIGHEITHGFDKNGALYNQYGLKENWLPVQDAMKFSDLCDKVAEYYTTIHPLSGGPACNGSLLTGEATADMGGLRVTLDLAAADEDFDYDAYFRQYALIWALSIPEDRAQAQYQSDVHPPAYLRVNVGLQQFAEFQETYGITENDGMYLAEDRRIAVW